MKAGLIKVLKNAIDYLLYVYLKIRWDKIQSTASYVVLFGLGLTGASFWDIAWNLVFEPAGFDRTGMFPAKFGAIFVVLGLGTLILDRLSTRITPPSYLQDKAIYNKAISIMNWDDVDWFLNDLNGKYYRSKHHVQLRDFYHFLNQDSYRFSNLEIRKCALKLSKSAQNLSFHIGRNFTGPNSVGSDIIEWHYDKNSYHGAPNHDIFLSKSRELESLSLEFENSFRQFLKAGNRLSFVEVV